jgi:hypothetical protein
VDNKKVDKEKLKKSLKEKKKVLSKDKQINKHGEN